MRKYENIFCNNIYNRNINDCAVRLNIKYQKIFYVSIFSYVYPEGIYRCFVRNIYSSIIKPYIRKHTRSKLKNKRYA